MQKGFVWILRFAGLISLFDLILPFWIQNRAFRVSVYSSSEINQSFNTRSPGEPTDNKVQFDECIQMKICFLHAQQS